MSENTVQCHAIVGSGERCKRNPGENSLFCKQHQSKRAGSVLPTPSDNEAIGQGSDGRINGAFEERMKTVLADVNKSTEAKWKFADIMGDISDQYCAVFDAHGQSVASPPSGNDLGQWLIWASSIRSDNKALFKELSDVDTRAIYGCFVETLKMRPNVAAEHKRQLRQTFNLSLSAYKKVAACVVAFPTIARMIARGQIKPRVYQTALSFRRENWERFEICKAEKQEKTQRNEETLISAWINQIAHVVWQNTTDKDGRHVITKKALQSHYDDYYNRSEITDALVSVAQKDNRSEVWAEKVANGKASLASIPSDIQALAIPLVEKRLASKGITTVSQGSVLYPIMQALKNDSTLQQVSTALESLASITERLRTRHTNLLAETYASEQQALDAKVASLPDNGKAAAETITA